MTGSIENKLEATLVVDDTAMVVDAVVPILEAANFVVLPASSGLDALILAPDYTGTVDLLAFRR
jgi:DNA-binding response OmpR family regulator